MNIVMLIGKIVDYIFDISTGSAALNISVKRDFKNQNGEYVCDTFSILLPSYLGEATFESIRNGTLKNDDYISVKGRVEMVNNELKIIAHKIQFFGEVVV